METHNPKVAGSNPAPATEKKPRGSRTSEAFSFPLARLASGAAVVLHRYPSGSRQPLHPFRAALTLRTSSPTVTVPLLSASKLLHVPSGVVPSVIPTPVISSLTTT
jgi:hypothetical protein